MYNFIKFAVTTAGIFLAAEILDSMHSPEVILLAILAITFYPKKKNSERKWSLK